MTVMMLFAMVLTGMMLYGMIAQVNVMAVGLDVVVAEVDAVVAEVDVMVAEVTVAEVDAVVGEVVDSRWSRSWRSKLLSRMSGSMSMSGGR